MSKNMGGNKKNTGFTLAKARTNKKHCFDDRENIGTTEKALALHLKAQKPTKRQWLYYKKPRNQQHRYGFTVKNIGTNGKAQVLMIKKSIGTNKNTHASL